MAPPARSSCRRRRREPHAKVDSAMRDAGARDMVRRRAVRGEEQRGLMKIADGCVVEIEYTLRDDDGEVIDSSSEEGTLHYLHGQGQIVPGLQRVPEGRVAGDAVSVLVAPEEGYGPHFPDRVVTVPRNRLPADEEPEVGMVLEGNGPSGETLLLRVVEVTDEGVTLDANHPLAGENLHFEVTVRAIREATEQELQHGHAHGPDGHHHH